MHRAWATSALVVSAAARPWAAVRGPAGAVVATLRRIDWPARSSRVWVTDQGVVMDFLHTSPSSLTVLVDRATERWLHLRWARAAGAPHLAGTLFLEPLRALIRRAPRLGWSSAYARAPRSVVVGAQWPQVRLAAAGYVASPHLHAVWVPA